jgi:NAD dependent epimerase/dehydratase family enzyme
MIGRALRARLEGRGDDVRVLVRRPPRDQTEYGWEARVGSVPPEAITWADAVVSLSGAPIARLPWTRRYRREIMTSRVDSTSALAQAILDADRPPRVWVAASATGWYGDQQLGAGMGAGPDGGSEVGRLSPGADPPLTESSPSGSGFLAAVVRAWEAAALPAAGVSRLVRARTGIVLGPDGGTLQPLIWTTKAGLGVRFGSGRQYWPWISLRDEVRAWEFCLDSDSVAGAVNLVGPIPATAGEIADGLARQLHRPRWLAVPAPVLRLALGDAAEDLILASQPVKPAVLEEHGFGFLDRTAEAAIRTALKPSA